MLQGRLFAYGDTHRYRLGINHTSLPVNRPHAAEVNNYGCDGARRKGDRGLMRPVPLFLRIPYSFSRYSYSSELAVDYGGKLKYKNRDVITKFVNFVRFKGNRHEAI